MNIALKTSQPFKDTCSIFTLLDKASAMATKAKPHSRAEGAT